MLRSSSSVLTSTAAQLRSAARRRSRYLLLASSTTTTPCRHWSSGGTGNRAAPNKPEGLEPQSAAARPPQGRDAHEGISSSNSSTSRANSSRSSWVRRPAIPHQERRQHAPGGQGAAPVPRIRRLSSSSTPWWVGGPAPPPAPPSDGSPHDGRHGRRARRGQQEDRHAGSGQRNHKQQGQEEGWWPGWQQARTNGRAVQ